MTKKEIVHKLFNNQGGFVNGINNSGGELVMQTIERSMEEYAKAKVKEYRDYALKNGLAIQDMEKFLEV